MKWSQNSAWFEMSARYSKTSSRGRSMSTDTVTGSTAGGSLERGPRPWPPAARRSGGGPDAQPDGVATLAVRHPLGRHEAPPAVRATQLTDQAPAEAVHELTDERRPPARRAARARRLQRADALAQQAALEVLLGDTEDGAQHPPTFAARADVPARPDGGRSDRDA